MGSGDVPPPYPPRLAGGGREGGRNGAIAQLGERLNGIQEVVGSIPIGSTNTIKDLAENQIPRRSHCVRAMSANPMAVADMENDSWVANRVGNPIGPGELTDCPHIRCSNLHDHAFVGTRLRNLPFMLN